MLPYLVGQTSSYVYFVRLPQSVTTWAKGNKKTEATEGVYNINVPEFIISQFVLLQLKNACRAYRSVPLNTVHTNYHHVDRCLSSRQVLLVVYVS